MPKPEQINSTSGAVVKLSNWLQTGSYIYSTTTYSKPGSIPPGTFVAFLKGLFMGQVKLHGSGRAGSGRISSADPTRRGIVLDVLTWPDPTRPASFWKKPDPTRPVRFWLTREIRVMSRGGSPWPARKIIPTRGFDPWIRPAGRHFKSTL